MRIYPQKPNFRDTEKSFEIDDNDPDFIRDPTGLYAIYYGVEPALLLISTETEGHWDVIEKIRTVHLEKLFWLFRKLVPQPVHSKIIDARVFVTEDKKVMGMLLLAYQGRGVTMVVDDIEKLLKLFDVSYWDEIVDHACRINVNVIGITAIGHPTIENRWVPLTPPTEDKKG